MSKKKKPRARRNPTADLVEKQAGAGALDVETAAVGLSVCPESWGDLGDPDPLDIRELRPAFDELKRRFLSADRPLDEAVLSSVINTLRDSLRDLAEGGPGSPADVRILLWACLRRYRGLLARRSWSALLGCWNAAQAGRDEWKVRNEGKDLPRITYDLPPAGESGLRRPRPGGGINMPAARIRRLVGFRL